MVQDLTNRPFQFTNSHRPIKSIKKRANRSLQVFLIKSNIILINSAVSDGQLHRSWQRSAASARSFVKGLNLHIHSAGAIEYRPGVCYRAVRESYIIIINPILARPGVGREGEGDP